MYVFFCLSHMTIDRCDWISILIDHCMYVFHNTILCASDQHEFICLTLFDIVYTVRVICMCLNNLRFVFWMVCFSVYFSLDLFFNWSMRLTKEEEDDDDEKSKQQNTHLVFKVIFRFIWLSRSFFFSINVLWNKVRKTKIYGRSLWWCLCHRLVYMGI